MLQPPIGVYIWAFLASVNSPKTFRFRHRSSVRKPAAATSKPRTIRQFSENECIQDISQILPRQRPVRSVERVELGPASDVHARAAGNHQAAHNEGEHDFPCRDIAYHRKESALSEKIEARPYLGSENNHRMQPDKPPLEESPCSHLSPSVIVCIVIFPHLSSYA